MPLKKGDLIRFKRSGKLATVMRAEYTARFIDWEDEEMISHGMGEFAGTYGHAIDVCYIDTMQKVYKVKVSYQVIEVVSQLDTSLTKKGLTSGSTSSIIDS